MEAWPLAKWPPDCRDSAARESDVISPVDSWVWVVVSRRVRQRKKGIRVLLLERTCLKYLLSSCDLDVNDNG
jgi:hypothetical protein